MKTQTCYANIQNVKSWCLGKKKDLISCMTPLSLEVLQLTKM